MVRLGWGAECQEKISNWNCKGFGVSIIVKYINTSYHPSRKLTWQSNMTLKIMGDTSSNRCFFHCRVSFPGVVVPSMIFVGSWRDPLFMASKISKKDPTQPLGPTCLVSWRGWWKNCPRNSVFLGWSNRIAHFHYTFSVSLIWWMSGNPNTRFLINHKHKAPKHESQDSTKIDPLGGILNIDTIEQERCA